MYKTPRIVIKQNNRVFDIFSGEEGFGPESWTRFVVVGNGKNKILKYIKGCVLNKEDYANVHKVLLGA